MIFSSSQYWTPDAMQWALNADRLDEGYRELARQAVNGQITEAAKADVEVSPVFASTQIANKLQSQLNADLAQVDVR
jgi:hypothetical protein